MLTRSVALLSPLRTGSGVKIKVLEALARGLPVVATPAGVQGIDAGEDTGCLIATTPPASRPAIATACDPDVNSRLSAAARAAWDDALQPRRRPAPLRRDLRSDRGRAGRVS